MSVCTVLFVLVALAAHVIAAETMGVMRTTGDMMKRNAETVYEMFKNGQMEDLVSLMDKDVVWDATASRNPWGGLYRGREQIREHLVDHKNAIEYHAFSYDVLEADEGRGTVLVRIATMGKVRSTGKSFKFAGHHLLKYENGHPKCVKMWGNENEVFEASKTPAAETFYEIEKAFFSRDTAALKSTIGTGKLISLGNSMDPSVGTWTHEQWMKILENYYMNYTSQRMLHVSKNRVISEYTAAGWGLMETGQTLMGSKPEEFRFYVHVTTDDNGKLLEMEMHSAPQPSEFLFAQRHGEPSTGREL